MKFLQNNLKKIISSITALVLIVTLFTSCKKDEAPVVQPSSTIEGSWVGKRGDGNATPDYDYRFKIKTGGVLEVVNSSGGVKGNGTWSLNGTAFTAHYQFVAPLFTVYSVKATYSKADGKLTGTWGFDSDDTSEGTWYMNKQ